MQSDVDLVLASASPRRRELLERMGLRLAVAPADVDETPLPGERAGDYVRRVAGAKCDAACAALAQRLSRGELVQLVREEMLKPRPGDSPPAPPAAAPAVLAADTTVVV